MNNYLVSFCVPIYKIDMPRVKRCLNSILRCGLDKDKYEVIIVDDGNTEEYEKELRSHIEQFDLKYIKHYKNLSLFQARKTAISHATGEYICHVDSDDWLEPNCLADLENLLKIQQPDLIQYQNIMHRLMGQNIQRWKYFGIGEDLYKKYIFTENKSVEDAIIMISTREYNTPIWGKLIKREIYINNWDHIPPQDAYINLQEDVVWAIHIFPHVKSICYANIKMYHYDRTNESMSINIEKITKQKLETIFTIKHSSDEIIKETERLTNSEEVRRKIREFEINDIMFYCMALICDNDIFDSPETKEYGIKRFEEVFGKDISFIKKHFSSNPNVKISKSGLIHEKNKKRKIPKKCGFKRYWD